MADIIDQANDQAEKSLAQSLRAHHQAARQAVRPAATGYCLNNSCLESLDEPGRLYCGAACAEAHHRQTLITR